MVFAIRRRPRRYSVSQRGLAAMQPPPIAMPVPGMPPDGANASGRAAPPPQKGGAPSGVLPGSSGGEVPSIAQPYTPQPKTMEQGAHGPAPVSSPNATFSGLYRNDRGESAEVWFDAATGLSHLVQNGQDVAQPFPGYPGATAQRPPNSAGPGLPGYGDPGQTAAQPAPTGQPASNPDAGTNRNYGGSATTADTAMIGGVKVWAGGPYAGMPVSEHPDGGDLTPYLKDPNAPDPTGRVQPVTLTPVSQ